MERFQEEGRRGESIGGHVRTPRRTWPLSSRGFHFVPSSSAAVAPLRLDDAKTSSSSPPLIGFDLHFHLYQSSDLPVHHQWSFPTRFPCVCMRTDHLGPEKMTSLSGLGIGLSFVFAFLFLALVAEVYYLLWWKKRVASGRTSSTRVEDDYATSAREFLDLFCWKKPTALNSAPFPHREICTSVRVVDGSEGGHLPLDPQTNKEPILKPFGGGGGGGDEGLDAELMRLHSLSGPPRILFTIKEETGEDLESEEGRTRRRTLSDLLLAAESPFSSPPLFDPPRSPLCSYDRHGFNPLFESQVEDDKRWVWASPPPKFKFLRDAEEKLYRKTLTEEALRVHTLSGVSSLNPALDASPRSPPFATISIVGC